MPTTLAPVTLRMSAAGTTSRVCAAVVEVKEMSVEELRGELRARRNASSADRERAQREAISHRAAERATRLRALAS
ncbi:hypothetical protein [Microbacterium sp. RU33B]|uniref:hypothetical protein n=1 Tax=Microbacterium sp. RU33B TaxID=1907390 RepID=UPI0011800A52|nr:hypothetical protein [Microbacterium sp. RU33B]